MQAVKLDQDGCQKAYPHSNTNPTRRSLFELCESAKCMINCVCQGGFMAENGYSWSHGLWLFQIIGFDNVLLAPKQAKFILVCGPIKQSLCGAGGKFHNLIHIKANTFE